MYIISDINKFRNPPFPLQNTVTVLVDVFEKAFLHVNPRDISLSCSFIPTASKCNWSEKLWHANLKCVAPNGASFGSTVGTKWCRGIASHHAVTTLEAASDAVCGRCISSLRSLRHGVNSFSNFEGSPPHHLIFSDLDFDRGSAFNRRKGGSAAGAG